MSRDTGGWYTRHVGALHPTLSHWYTFHPPSQDHSLAWFKPRCGHPGARLDYGVLVPAPPAQRGCRRCVRMLARDLMRAAATRVLPEVAP